MAWLSGWAHRKSIILSRTSGAVTNYQMKMRLYDGALPIVTDGSAWAVTPRNSPSSAYYNGYTYAVYAGVPDTGDGDPYIRKYDHSTGQWSAAVKIGTNPAGAATYNSAPCIIVRTDTDHVGKLLVIFGGASATTNAHWVESTNAEDITAWGSPADFGSAPTQWHSLVQVANGDIYCFHWNAAQKRAYRKMTAGGTTWSAATDIVYLDSNASDNLTPQAPVYDSANNLIWFTGAYYEGATHANYEGIYVYAYNPATDKLRDAAGNEVSLAVSKATFESGDYKFAVFTETGSEETLESASIVLDSSNRPQVTYAYYAGLGNWALKFTSWNGSAWASASTVVETESPSNVIVWRSASDIDVYATDSNASPIDISRYNWNGAAWSKAETLMLITATQYGEKWNNLTPTRDAAPSFRFMVEAQDTSTMLNSCVFACGDSGWLSLDSGSSVGLNGGALSDYDDVRFTTSNGTTLLDYWIEAGAAVAGRYADVWVEYDSIGTSATTFYLYYGKSDATAVSSGANTFIVFDDFEGGTNGNALASPWVVEAGTATYSNAQKYGGSLSAKFASGGTNGRAYIPVDHSDNIAIQVRVFKEAGNLFNMAHGDGTNLAYVQCQDDEDVVWYDGASFRDTGDNITAAAWQLLGLRNFVWATPVVDIVLNDTVIQAAADISYASAAQDGRLRFDVSAADNLYIDNVIVRNWRATDPAWGDWGAEAARPTSRVMIWS